MTWRLVREAQTLRFGSVELHGEILHDSAQNALCLVDPRTAEEEVLTVGLFAEGYTAAPDHVFVRDYSEHYGLPDALVAAGVCEPVEELSVGPFGSRVRRMRVLTEG